MTEATLAEEGECFIPGYIKETALQEEHKKLCRALQLER